MFAEASSGGALECAMRFPCFPVFLGAGCADEGGSSEVLQFSKLVPLSQCGFRGRPRSGASQGSKFLRALSQGGKLEAFKGHNSEYRHVFLWHSLC